MTRAPTQAGLAIERIIRDGQGRLLALLIKHAGDFALAEEALQEAVVAALDHWERHGFPHNPTAWLLQVARRKAIDRLRRGANWKSKQPDLEYLLRIEQEAPEQEDNYAIPDERLRLIFTCCHPALGANASVALTLRTVCGLSTEEIARAFVVPRETMAQRIVRAQQKIAKAGIPYEVPGAGELEQRIEAVLSAVYLIFNEGYAPYSRSDLRRELCAEALRLAEMLETLLPEHDEISGLRALMLLHTSRFDSRIGSNGAAVALEHQDRSLWRRDLIAEGTKLLERTLRRGKPGPYLLQAAIAAIHCESISFAATDWREIVMIYSRLLQVQPNPVFALNRVVALSYAEPAAQVLPQLLALEPELGGYQPFHASKADVLARAGRVLEADEAYDKAIGLCKNELERGFLLARRTALATPARKTDP